MSSNCTKAIVSPVKIKLLIFVLSTTLFLHGCIGYHKTGYIVPENDGYREIYGESGNAFYKSKVPLNVNDSIFISGNSKTIVFQMPNKIEDENCKYISGFIVPFSYSNDCGYTWAKKSNNFFVSLEGNPYTDEFINNLNMYLIHNGKQYSSQKKLRKSYATFVFPVMIGDIKNDILVIRYKNYSKNIPIKYELLYDINHI